MHSHNFNNLPNSVKIQVIRYVGLKKQAHSLTCTGKGIFLFTNLKQYRMSDLSKDGRQSQRA